MNKITHNNKVAVLLSTQHGNGFATLYPELASHPLLVLLVLYNVPIPFSFIQALNPVSSKDINHTSIPDLRVEWVPLDTRFTISSHDGVEWVIKDSDLESIFRSQEPSISVYTDDKGGFHLSPRTARSISTYYSLLSESISSAVESTPRL